MATRDGSGTVVVTADPRAVPETGAGAPSPGGEDRYLLRVSPERIDIAGATPRDALSAAYDLLERLEALGVEGNGGRPSLSPSGSVEAPAVQAEPSGGSEGLRAAS